MSCGACPAVDPERCVQLRYNLPPNDGIDERDLCECECHWPDDPLDTDEHEEPEMAETPKEAATVPTPDELRREAAKKRAEAWRYLGPKARNAVIDRMRGGYGDHALAAQLLEDLADGRI